MNETRINNKDQENQNDDHPINKSILLDIPNMVKALEVLTLFFVLVGFVGLFTVAIYHTWNNAEQQNQNQTQVLGQGEELDQELEAGQVQETNQGQDADQDQETSGEKWFLTDTALYVATAISGFMMTFFANKMGITLDEVELNKERKKAQAETRFISKLVTKYLDGEATYTLTKKMIGSIYMLVFFVVAIAAIVTWVFHPEAESIIKNVASISVTMFIGIAKGVLDSI